MDSGKLKISHIPFKFYDKDAFESNKKLPSELRNIDIISGIKFGEFLKYVNENDESNVISWLNQHRNKLKLYLNRKKNKLNQQKRDKYCTNLNYILDFVVQALKNFNNSIEFFKLIHDFDENSKNILNSYESLKCPRNLHNSKDKNLYIKKIMYDLFDDIKYMLSVQNKLRGTPCSKMIKRINYRRGILREIYVAVDDKSIFNFDNDCTLSKIDEKLQSLKCNTTPKTPKAMSVTEPQPTTEVTGSEGDLLKSRESEDGEETIDVENPELVDRNLDDLQIGLPFNEDPPKLDTTYAAASLAGISLFGTILYKYGPFRNRLNPRRGAINGSNIFPLDNNVHDATLMNNFEYLQTGIPNDEYQLGYGSVTDY
ncbi:unnamed protein product [Plasmodium vivax]|uniref:(malaria parasite P. vivax) hypothetical protein n=1 Tax=Plasmodium vivax TaxID=5855 RepID=A0A8S4H9E5_PLAVI|nr:unnamed protein product [Plasmodium vivax]